MKRVSAASDGQRGVGGPHAALAKDVKAEPHVSSVTSAENPAGRLARSRTVVDPRNSRRLALVNTLMRFAAVSLIAIVGSSLVPAQETPDSRAKRVLNDPRVATAMAAIDRDHDRLVSKS